MIEYLLKVAVVLLRVDDPVSVCVGLLFGGRSVEHEVSLSSATSILKALDPDRYQITLIAVDHSGRWHLSRAALPCDADFSGTEVTVDGTDYLIIRESDVLAVLS